MKKVKNIILMLLIILTLNLKISFAISPQVATALNELLKEYKIHLNVFIAFGFLTSLLSFVINFTRLGIYSSNPQQRATVIRNLIISGICASIFGSLGFFIMFFFATVFS